MRQLVVGALLLVVGCSRSARHADNVVGPRLEPGYRVVARIGGGFQEATVLAARGKLVGLVTDGATELRLPRSWVTPLVFADAPIADGEWRLCAVDEEWRLCRPTRTADGALRLSYVATDGTRRFADSWTLDVPPGVQTWAAREGGRRLDQALLAEVLPRLAPANAGASVTVGQAVVARWNGGGWWDATVKERRGAEIVVVWADGSAPSTLGAAEVAPAATGNGALDHGFALCRSGTSYAPAQVSGAPGGWSAAFSDGKSIPVAPADCVPARVR